MNMWAQQGRSWRQTGTIVQACIALCASLALVLAPLFVHRVAALTTITQGYTSSEPVPLGSVVSLEKDSADRVVPAHSSNVDNLLGVVVNDENSLLSVSNGRSGEVQVATSGTVQVLISDINGAVERGDMITASPIRGVGMKANGNVRVIGIAQGKITGDNKQTYKDKDGKDQPVTLGQAPVLVNVAYYFKEPEKTIVPFALQNVANSLAGKAVSTVPILVSSAIFVVTLIIVVSIIYSMIRNGIISVGRNPLSQSAVYRNVIQMSALVIMILGVGVTSIYLVLTKM